MWPEAQRSLANRGSAGSVYFGPYRVDRATGELWKGGVRLRLQEQPFQVLVALVDSAGQLVTREELRKRLWPDDTYVDFDHALTTAVKKLRRALNDSALHPRYVETLPKRGYRFVAPVDERPPGAMAESPADDEPTDDSVLFGEQASARMRVQRNVAFAAAIAAVVALGVWLVQPAAPANEPAAAPVRRYSIAPPGGRAGAGLRAAVSPDGRSIAWVLPEPDSPIWVRDFDREQPRAIEGTAGADLPSWSPDGQYLAFARDAALRKVSVHGGPVTVLCPLADSIFAGSTWSPDGSTIVFSTGLPPVLYEVSSAGGEPKPFPDPVAIHLGGANVDPRFLRVPGRRLLAFAVGGPNAHEIFVRDLNDGRQVRIGPGRAPVFDPRGLLLYQSDGVEGGLWAMPFDVKAFTPTGAPLPVAETGVSASISRDGTLVYVDEPKPAPQQLALYDRSGERLEWIGRPQDRVATPAISPDGGRVALRGLEEGNYDIWIYEIAGGARTRVSFAPAFDADPVWSARGDRLIWRVDRQGNADVVGRALDSDEEQKVLLAGPGGERPTDSTADGAIVYSISDFQTGSDLWLAEPKADGSGYDTRPLLNSRSNETSGRVSPNGRFLAYCSDESGAYEVYVRPFPQGGRAWKVSRNGGCQPRWSRGGDELFFVSGAALHSARVAAAPDLVVGPPDALFENAGLASTSPFFTNYDVAADGQSFVLVETVAAAATRDSTSIVRVVENWWVEAIRPFAR